MESQYAEALAALRRDDLESFTSLLEQYPELAIFRPELDWQGNQNTLLHEVTGMGEVRHYSHAATMARFLLAAGADVDAPERIDGGETPLIHAVSINNVPVAEVLLAAAADPGRHGRHDGSIDTALGYALFYGVHELPRFPVNCPELLIGYGARVYLPFAAAMGWNGKLPDYFDESGQLRPDASPASDPLLVLNQALLFAARYGNIEGAAFLLERGAQINTPIPFFHYHLTALHLAAEQGQRRAMAAFLLDAGANPGIRDSGFGSTPLGWARHCRQEPVEDLFLERGIRE